MADASRSQLLPARDESEAGCLAPLPTSCNLLKSQAAIDFKPRSSLVETMPEDSLPEAYLVLIADRGQREVHRVHRTVMTLGRGPESDLVLTNPRVSRRHAQLTWDGQRFLIRDLGSKNGTRINGAAVTAPRPVNDGDSLELADSRLQFQTSAPTVTIVAAPGAEDVAVDLSRHEVRVRGDLIALTPKEYRLLVLLYCQGGAVVTREDIATEVWPELEGAVAEESIAQLIARLRRKLEENPTSPRHILTVRGFGYRFAVADQAAPSAAGPD